jgi:diguanylate cyclase (GGDEF)-like protein/PAS domain S-box-containing protein
VVALQAGSEDATRFKLLIFEDKASSGETYSQFLEQEGFLVSAADSYDQAIALMDDSIDLVLLDIQPDDMTCYDILAYIRMEHPACPTIIISRSTDKKNAIGALRQGATEIIEKPADRHVLMHSIRRWLDYNRLTQERPQARESRLTRQEASKNRDEACASSERLNFLLTSTATVIYASKISEKLENYATTYISDNIRRISGYEAEDFIGDPDFRMSRIHPDDLGRVKSELKRTLKTASNHFEYRFRHKDGHYFWVDDKVKLEKNLDGEIELFGLMEDITERKQQVEKITQKAYIDQLTGLPNRSLYYDRLKQAIAQSRRNKSKMAVMFMDLDYFKPINDELGHEWGDQALIIVAKRLKKCIRETDTVARIGGDEFSIILGDVASEEAVGLVADKIISSVREPMMLNETPYTLGISIGICMKSHDDGDMETIMRLADDAMYQAKEMGRNRYCFHRDSGHVSSSDLNKEMNLEKALRQAATRNELVIHYQPKMAMKDGMITGMHALLRWNRPGSEMVMPAQFLPLARKTGLIVPIGEWVLRQACRQNKAWQDAGLPIVPISVNVTAEQLRDNDFSYLVAHILDETGLTSDMLQVEIDESDLMHHGLAAMQTMKDLNVLGVKITIANFGTGYFSLESLKTMPVHELKLNRELVTHLGEKGDSGQIANAIISMGHILNHQVVAEGVETIEQLKFLREHKSDGMLGYLLSPPIPADEIVHKLKNKKLMALTPETFTPEIVHVEDREKRLAY